MTDSIKLALVFHNHQPVGNFDFVFETAFRHAYLPMVEMLERYPNFKVGLHYTGPLRNWLVNNHPDFFPRVKALAGRGQVEILAGAFYEPILSAIPDIDKRGQVERMRHEVQQDFGVAAQGAWLAERVWEPSLAKHLAEAGIGYTIVDDTHFRNVGITHDEDLMGYYLTEEQGVPLRVFGSSKYLRYSIPWVSVEEVIAYLQQARTSAGDRVAFMGDDGEKFGLWPGTWQYVWGGDEHAVAWMEKFARALQDNASWLIPVTPSEYIAQHPAIGRVYLPTASYDEMSEWALPAEPAHAIVQLKAKLREEHRDDILQFIKGGFWRVFLAKYGEVNNMHKKMLRASHKVHAMPAGELKEQALDALWQGQCNCPYWHGVFGGVYLAHIRRANYEQLIRAESLADSVRQQSGSWLSVSEEDFDCDSQPEWLLESEHMNAYFTPAKGAHLFEWDDRRAAYNLLNGFTRVREGYHQDLVEAKERGAIVVTGSAMDQDSGGIHGHLVRVKEAGVENELVFDWYRREGLIDHFLHPEAELAAFARGDTREAGDFVNGRYESRVFNDGKAISLTFSRSGGVWRDGNGIRIRLGKTVTLQKGSRTLQVAYTIANEGQIALATRFGVECNFALLSAHHADGYCLIDGEPAVNPYLDAYEERPDVRRVEVGHRWYKAAVHWSWDQPAVLWRAPLFTVSQSEGGFERVYQATTVMPLWRLELPAGAAWKLAMTLGFEEERQG
jgi:4-alpha-glucanotransferase